MKIKTLSLIALLFLSATIAVNAQSKKVKAFESSYVQGGETANETIGTAKPGTLFAYNSKTNTKYSRIGFLKFKLPKDVKSLKSVELNLNVKIFKNPANPEQKFVLDVQAITEGTWSPETVTFNNAPKLGEVIGSTLIEQSLDDQSHLVIIKLNNETVNNLLMNSKDGEITIALANNVEGKIGSVINGKDAYLIIE
ncbi:CBM96 family carbohydrate-binding protein [Flavobacterium sp. WC2509]|uniref:CBM96 family carbohydrate-binding protein n=1 Tax=Flavobacterium sp. WC2509 TaxID=3461406 RepID=UPI00404493C8